MVTTKMASKPLPRVSSRSNRGDNNIHKDCKEEEIIMDTRAACSEGIKLDIRDSETRIFKVGRLTLNFFTRHVPLRHALGGLLRGASRDSPAAHWALNAT